MTTPNLSIVILAAGMSQRMGAVNKLLIPVNGKPMIRHTAETYLSLDTEQVIVVLGHEYERIKAELKGLKLTLVFNQDYAEGQLTSIRTGLKCVNKQADNVIIALADQPLLTVEDIQFLIETFGKQSSKTMLVPFYQGKRGNPMVLTGPQARSVDEDGIFLGCRKLVEKYPERVYSLNVDNHHYSCDLDTPADVAKVLGCTELSEERFT